MGRIGRRGRHVHATAIGARLCGVWSIPVLKLGVSALEAYANFRVRLRIFLHQVLFLSLRTLCDHVVTCERSWGVGCSSGISWSTAVGLCYHTASCSVELGTSTPCCNTPSLRASPVRFDNQLNFAYVLFSFVERTLSVLFTGWPCTESLCCSAYVFPHIIPQGISGTPRCAHSPCDRYVGEIIQDHNRGIYSLVNVCYRAG